MSWQSVFLIFVFSVTCIAQSPATILKKAERAMGGAKLMRNVVSVQRRGTIVRGSDGVSGNIVWQTSRPNLYNLSFDIGGFEVESGYSGKSGWTRDSRAGLRTLTGKASIDFQAEAVFRSTLWLDAKKEKTRIETGGRADVDGKPANVLILKTAKGSAIRLYFNGVSNLLVREEFSAADATRSFEYSDYRAVNGLNQAYRVKIEIDGTKYEATFREINPNVPIAKAEFAFPNLSGDALPDIPSLLKEVQANEDKVERILDTYSYIQKHIRRELAKDGTLRETGSETYQLSFYKGHRISRLIEKNGKPLSPADQADRDKDAAEYAEDIEKRITKRETTGKEATSDEGRRISIAELLRASTLSNPRRERFRGRDVIVFDFEPNPAFDYKNAKSMLKFFGKTAGAMWIDEKDKQVARLEAFLFDSFNIGGGVLAKLKKGASFTLEQERVNDEIWLPSTADINLSVRLFLVKGIDLNQIIRSYDYRRFSTEVKDAKVNPVKQ
jgi:hypothetical protein